MPTLSVIVPVYNAEAYLDRCVRSILAQTMADFELILIDDGSTDKSYDICLHLAQSDSRVKVHQQKNSGPASARNLGVQHACGKYVTFIDSDDLIPTNYLEFLYSGIRKYHADISVVLESECTDPAQVTPIYTDDYLLLSGDEAIRHTFRNFDSSFRSSWAKLVLRSIALTEPFPVDRSYSEDTATVYRWYLKAEKVVLNSSKLYFYVQNATSLVHIPFNYSRLGIFKTYDEMLDFFMSNNFEDLCPSLLEIYIQVACSHYQQLIDILHDSKTAKCVRKRIKQLLKKGKKHGLFSPSNVPQAYNIVYPTIMFFYWILIGIKNRLSN